MALTKMGHLRLRVDNAGPMFEPANDEASIHALSDDATKLRKRLRRTNQWSISWLWRPIACIPPTSASSITQHRLGPPILIKSRYIALYCLRKDLMRALRAVDITTDSRRLGWQPPMGSQTSGHWRKSDRTSQRSSASNLTVEGDEHAIEQ